MYVSCFLCLFDLCIVYILCVLFSLFNLYVLQQFDYRKCLMFILFSVWVTNICCYFFNIFVFCVVCVCGWCVYLMLDVVDICCLAFNM